MFVSGRRGAVITTLLQDTPHTLMPAARRASRPTGAGSNCRQPLISCLPRWSATEPHGASRRCRPSKLNSHPFRRLVKVRCCHISEVVRLSARVRYWGQNGLCQTLPTSHGVKVAILQCMVRKRFDRAANIRAVFLLCHGNQRPAPALGFNRRDRSTFTRQRLCARQILPIFRSSATSSRWR